MAALPSPTVTNGKAMRMWRAARRWLINLCLVYVGMIIVLMFLENYFIYHPTTHADAWNEPKDSAIQDVWLDSADGTRIHAWWCPVPDAKWVVLYCHGNAGNLSHRQDTIRLCWQQRVKASVLIFDYPGYGRSEGKPSEAKCYAAAATAYDWLRETAKISPDRIVLFGSSLGGAVAVELAMTKPHGALVLLSAFTCVGDMGQELFPFLPCRWFARTCYDNLQKLANYQGCLFHAHGTADLVVPYTQGERLFEAAKNVRCKEFLRMADVGHHDGAGYEFYDKLLQFLTALPVPEEGLPES